ncbi:DUF4249 domain-containing protein [Runella zeae]|uniref:DUF4249 domain-containing protein n=1 Tax=Runella zeae TaxID=94255 RepID=UPI00048C4ABD|nr:DUF4249 domain-containing protein [Runella zeae]
MRSFVCIFLVAVIGLACEVSTVKNVDIPSAPTKLVVNGVATNVGIGVFVTKTYPVLEPVRANPPLSAIVSLKKNEQVLETLQFENNLYITNKAWDYNSSFVVEVQNPQLGIAKASLEALPSSIGLKNALASQIPQTSEAQVTMSFQDLPGENFYAYKIIPIYEGIPFQNESIYQIPTNKLLSDVGFESQIHTIKDRILLRKDLGNNQDVVARQLKICFYHLSKNTYDYYRLVHDYDSYHDDAFAQSISVSNNIQNGYGYVGVCHMDTLTVNIKQ